jgi:hypothetical protein
MRRQTGVVQYADHLGGRMPYPLFLVVVIIALALLLVFSLAARLTRYGDSAPWEL